MRLSEYIISVSKRHKNNHAGAKSGTWSIYYYDEEGKILKTFDSFDSEDDLEEQRIMERMEDPEGGILLN